MLDNLSALQPRLKVLEKAQGTTVEALIRRITNYGSRRVEDFDKYEALRLAEDLVSVAKTSGNAKAASYEIIASTLREKVSVSIENFILRPIFWPFSRIRNFLVSLIRSLRSIKLLSVNLLIHEAPNLAARKICHDDFYPTYSVLQVWYARP